mgnify:CR=1 FL=1
MGNNLLSLGTRSGKSQENQPWRKFGNKKLKDVDHDATDEVNLLMDRWSPSDVLILMRKFKQQARLQHSKKSDKKQKASHKRNNSNSSNNSNNNSDEEEDEEEDGREESVPLTLDLEGFCQIFSELEHMPQDMARAAFGLFCKEGDTMDFREFCTAITICCYGSAEKKASIIFNLFDSDKDGFLTAKDVEELAQTAMASMERLESEDRSSSRTTWMRQAGQELLNDLSKSKDKISLQVFLSWAEKNMVITYLLELFRIVPTSEIEARTVRKILKKHNEMKVNDVWHVLSSKWWETWCMYTSYRAFDFAHDETQNKGKLKNSTSSTANNLLSPSSSIKVSNGNINDINSKNKGIENVDEMLESSTAVSDIQMNDTNPVSPYFSPENKPKDGNDIIMDKLDLQNNTNNNDNVKGSSSSSSASSSNGTTDNNSHQKQRKTLVRSRSLSHTSGDRPGPFDNYHLQGDDKGTLKLNLLEGHDYVLIPDALWKHLENWYGGGPDYSRNVISLKGAQGAKKRRTPYYNPPGRDGVVLEMHPLVLIFASMDLRTGRPSKGAKEFRKMFSLVNTVKDMKSKVCKHLNVDPENSRLWLKPKGGEWRCLSLTPSTDSDEENVPSEQVLSLADADVETGDFIMIETKDSDDDVWPRDLIDEQNENFRDFELNSKVDAKDKDGKWFAGTVVDLKANDDEELIEVKIHFDRFNPKWDEWYDVDSPKLKPLFTITEPRSDNVDVSGSNRVSRVSGNAVEQGAVGLINLGNTCYMNSVLQCLSNTPMLCNYFRTGLFEKELNIANKRGSGGEVAFEFAQMLSKLWIDQTVSPVKAIAPKKFKRTFARTPMLTPFSGYGQQDAHEFFSVLLDIVHEDINRVEKKKKKKKEKEEGKGSTNGKKKRLLSVKSSSSSEDKKQNNGVEEKKSNKSASLEITRTSSSSSTENVSMGDENSNDDKAKSPRANNQVAPMIENDEQDNSNEGGKASTKNDGDETSGTNIDGTMEVKQTKTQPLDDNKIADKKWKEHLEENRSTIVDLFHGQLRRTLRCNSCGHKTLNFEPFHCLSVALNVQFAYNIVVVPLPKEDKKDAAESDKKNLNKNNAVNTATAYGVFTPQVGLVGDLKFELASLCKIPANRLIIATVENNMTVTIRPDRQHLHTIREDDNLFAFERPLIFNEICGHPNVEVNNIPLNTSGSNKNTDSNSNNIVMVNKSTCPIGCFSMCDSGSMEHDSDQNMQRNQSSGMYFCCSLSNDSVVESHDSIEEGNEAQNEEDDNDKEVEMTSTDIKNKLFDDGDETGNDENETITEALMHQRIDCLDDDGHWYASTVVEVNEETEEIKVRFDGYKAGFDEWIPYTDEYRIKPLYSMVRKPQLELVVATLLHRTVQQTQQQQEQIEAGLEMISTEINSLSSSKNVDNIKEQRYFGTPSLIYFSSHVSSAELLKIVDQHLSKWVKASKTKFSERKPYTVHINNLVKTKNHRQLENHPGLPKVRAGESIVIEWDSMDYYDNSTDKYEDHETVQKVKGARMQEQANGRKDIKLEDCLKEFSKPERLGEGYKCDKCKAVDTTMSQMDIWRLPDILVVHVKRFIYTMYVRGKLNNPMHYPIKGLDMSTVLGKRETDEFRDKELYDLYGVVHHMGSMGGGHYIATCKNSGGGKSNNWFEYNDSRVGKADKNDIVRSSGYLLFYHRKQLSAHNIINLSTPL